MVATKKSDELAVSCCWTHYTDRMQVLRTCSLCRPEQPDQTLELYRQWTAQDHGRVLPPGRQREERGMEISRCVTNTQLSGENTGGLPIDYIVHPLRGDVGRPGHPTPRTSLTCLRTTGLVQSMIPKAPPSPF
ncbi:unnamed protein product [Pleuronectes platessa]|uniref:Uncharacterized protein n=1 Tax=Pleuronectes platessa TaxID=8262 RepID=A0A9N7UKA2_PLEPL|nr:unnamed protein product [Pleuronectes platessa]